MSPQGNGMDEMEHLKTLLQQANHKAGENSQKLDRIQSILSPALSTVASHTGEMSRTLQRLEEDQQLYMGRLIDVLGRRERLPIFIFLVAVAVIGVYVLVDKSWQTKLQVKANRAGVEISPQAGGR